MIFLSRIRCDSPLSKTGRDDVPIGMLDPAAYRARGRNHDISKEDMRKIDGQGGKEHPFWKGNH